jgi:hypothetical protein
MNSQILGLRVAGTVFGLMGLGQFLRLVIRPEVFIGGYRFPLWPSALAFVILAGLSFWLWKISWSPIDKDSLLQKNVNQFLESSHE